jgi:Bacterial protein of unknown function (DUF899)
MTYFMKDELPLPEIVDRSAFDAEVDALRFGEKAHTREGDAIAAARWTRTRLSLEYEITFDRCIVPIGLTGAPVRPDLKTSAGDFHHGFR